MYCIDPNFLMVDPEAKIDACMHEKKHFTGTYVVMVDAGVRERKCLVGRYVGMIASDKAEEIGAV